MLPKSCFGVGVAASRTASAAASARAAATIGWPRRAGPALSTLAGSAARGAGPLPSQTPPPRAVVPGSPSSPPPPPPPAEATAPAAPSSTYTQRVRELRASCGLGPGDSGPPSSPLLPPPPELSARLAALADALAADRRSDPEDAASAILEGVQLLMDAARRTGGAAGAASVPVLSLSSPLLPALDSLLAALGPAVADHAAHCLADHAGTMIPSLRPDRFAVPEAQVVMRGGVRLNDVRAQREAARRRKGAGGAGAGHGDAAARLLPAPEESGSGPLLLSDGVSGANGLVPTAPSSPTPKPAPAFEVWDAARADHGALERRVTAPLLAVFDLIIAPSGGAGAAGGPIRSSDPVVASFCGALLSLCVRSGSPFAVGSLVRRVASSSSSLRFPAHIGLADLCRARDGWRADVQRAREELALLGGGVGGGGGDGGERKGEGEGGSRFPPRPPSLRPRMARAAPMSGPASLFAPFLPAGDATAAGAGRAPLSVPFPVPVLPFTEEQWEALLRAIAANIVLQPHESLAVARAAVVWGGAGAPLFARVRKGVRRGGAGGGGGASGADPVPLSRPPAAAAGAAAAATDSALVVEARSWPTSVPGVSAALEAVLAPHILAAAESGALTAALELFEQLQVALEGAAANASSSSATVMAARKAAEPHTPGADRSATVPLPAFARRGAGDGPATPSPSPAPQPSAGLWEAVSEAAARQGKPNLARRILRLMGAAGVSPSSPARNLAVRGAIVEAAGKVPGRAPKALALLLEAHADADKAAAAGEKEAKEGEGEKTDAPASRPRVPRSAYASVAEALARDGDDAAAVAVLRLAQSHGHLAAVDAGLDGGVVNLSGLGSGAGGGPAAIAAVLLDSLSSLRSAARNGAGGGSPIRALRLFHAPADRLLIRSLLEGLDPPLPPARTSGTHGWTRHLLIERPFGGGGGGGGGKGKPAEGETRPARTARTFSLVPPGRELVLLRARVAATQAATAKEGEGE
jgi:hypothetical protein